MFQYTILDTVKRPFVIYKDIFMNQYCLEPRRGMLEKKAMVITMPHSGAHLIQEILCSFDMMHVRVSHETDYIGDYRFLSDQDRIKFSRLCDTYMLPIRETIKWITPGQFVINHMKYDDTSYCLLRESDFLMYTMKRNLRNCVVSHARVKMHDKLCITHNKCKLMEDYIKMPYYNELVESIKLMMPWFTNNTFEELSYENIVGENGKDKQYQCLMRLIDDFELTNIKMDNIIDKCINKKTFSYSGEISRWQDYWSDEIEKWFAKIGLKTLNVAIGYK